MPVNALDDHNAHIMAHKELFNMAWLRKPDLAQKMGAKNAPQIMQGVMAHIHQHMQMLGQNQANSTAAHAPQQAGQAETQPQAALGHIPHAAPPIGNPAQDQGQAQAQAMTAGTRMPNRPSMPGPPR